MKNYELMFILPPDLGEEGTTKEMKEIRKIIAEEKGEVLTEDTWGIRELEYRIEKQDEGFYAVFIFSVNPEKIGEIEKGLNLNQKILRFLVTKTPEDHVLKTFAEYQKEWDLEDKKEEEAKKEADEKKKAGRRPSFKKAAPVVAARKPEKEGEETEKVEEEKEDEVEKEEAVEEVKPKEKGEKVEMAKEEAVEEVETKEKEEEKKEEKSSSEIDDKLKSIIDDPDISL